ncbi:alpha-mannosidase [Marinilabilia salmonicolor]|uniref:alpha-mannosidase n=1 Tax=Marinilabilia salmonicolor TaxID=989 RepID=UPI00029A192C|nr:glycoside hydrolase family 38 C-terminal domain-containing protein [Marinilabilia salmonicolor]
MNCKIFLLVIGALLPALLKAQPEGRRESYDISKEKVLYTIGYSHLDTEWNWDYPTTINTCIKNTMTENFYLFEKYPDYVFNFTGSRRYRMMKEYYPDLYEKVKYYINQGRWYVSGSSVDEGEVNVSSSESLIRQVLYGNKYFRDEFGVESADYMLPDCFGFLANLPTIWNHCGLLGFSTQKLTWHSAVGIPFNVGVWLGPDDKGIVAALNATSYVGGVVPRLDKDEYWKKRIDQVEENYGISFDYKYYGVGDEGGAPRENDVRNLEASIGNEDGDFKVVTTSSDQMYKDITPEIRKKLPSYKGDLMLIEHSAGSLTSQAYVKKMNRKNELLAKSAEQLACIADMTGSISYPFDKLNNAWDLVLGSQFHDILPGTSIPKAYEYAWNDEFIAANGFSNVLKSSVGAIADMMDTRTKGRSVVVYNPVSHNRQGLVEVEMEFDAIPEGVQVFNEKGEKVPTQVVGQSDNKLQLIFLANMPSVGVTVYDVRELKTSSEEKSSLSVTDYSLENEYYKVQLDTNGDILSVFDKKAKRELLEKPARLEFLYEEPDQWPAWNMDWNDRKNPPVGYMSEAPELKVLEDGPVRVAVEIKRQGRNSTITQIVSLSAGEAGKVVEVSNLVDWQARGVSLKASFPLSVKNKVATYNLGVGTIQRANNDSKKFEVPSKQWLDLTDENGEYGVSILEDCKYGSDKPSDNTLRLTLLYTPETHSWYPLQNSQDWGIHEFKYGIYGHKGDWRNGQTDWQGKYFNEPLWAFEVPKHKGTLGKNFSFVSVNKDEVGIMALKKMEEANDYYLVRVNELTGADVTGAEISFPWIVADAYEVNGQEKRIGKADFRGEKLSFDLSHNTIRSFAVKLSSPVSATKETQEFVKLPFNHDVISFDVNRHDGNFAWRRSLPAELIPDFVESDGVRFEMGNKQDRKNNAVICKGQEVNLPEGKYKTLYLLAAANRDTETEFIVDGDRQPLKIQGWTGYVGQFYNREFAKDGVTVTGIENAYSKKDNIAWFASHRHKSYPSGNEAYQYCYLYKYEIRIPEGAKTVKLPDDENVKVLAMTVGDKNSQVKPLQKFVEDFDYDLSLDIRKK